MRIVKTGRIVLYHCGHYGLRGFTFDFKGCRKARLPFDLVEACMKMKPRVVTSVLNCGVSTCKREGMTEDEILELAEQRDFPIESLLVEIKTLRGRIKCLEDELLAALKDLNEDHISDAENRLEIVMKKGNK